jgi:TonB family protein
LTVDLLTLTNLFRWSLQVFLLAVVGAALLRVLRIEAPVMRHAFWRALLVVCLALPLLQPWTAAVSPLLPLEDHSIASIVDTLPRSETAAPEARAGRALRALPVNWVTWTGVALIAGIVARLIWLAVGLVRLRHLRHAGQPAVARGGYDEIADLLEAGAEIRCVPGLGQPVTFGVFRPFVLLPDSFEDLPQPVQRALLAHELWHVRRRDWAWVLVEEGIRALFWFNPALWWLVSQVQSSREEVVDELTVQLTHSRKTYLEALLMFADRPAVFPAAPFARRRHLFHRMVLISREDVMSSRRIVTSSVAALAVVISAGWYGAATFPLTAAPQAPGQQNPPRDRRPGEAGPESAKESELKQMLAANAANRDIYFQLAGLQEARGARAEADETFESLRRAFPNDAGVLRSLATAYVRAGRFTRAVQTLEEVAALEPTNAQTHHLIAVFYWEKASKDPSLTPEQSLAYVKAGITSADRALELSPDYVDAMVYKNILLRMQSNLESDPSMRQALLAEAEALRARATELNKARAAGRSMSFAVRPQDGAPPPPPPPPPGEAATVDGVVPVRIGGELKPPTKVRDVRPIYPADAMAAKVQGVVIIESMVNTVGQVVSAHVLRGTPMLDEAAIEAVKQWQFTPTLLNGVPVPIVMTVTVNFKLE